MKPEKKTRRLTVSGAEKRDSLDLVAELTEGWNGLLLLLINCDDFFVSAAGLFLLVFWKNHTERHQLWSPQPKFWELFLYLLLLGGMVAKGSDHFSPYFLSSLHLQHISSTSYQVFVTPLLLYSPCVSVRSSPRVLWRWWQLFSLRYGCKSYWQFPPLIFLVVSTWSIYWAQVVHSLSLHFLAQLLCIWFSPCFFYIKTAPLLWLKYSSL